MRRGSGGCFTLAFKREKDLSARVAELEARLLDYEEQVRESVLSGRNNAAFVEMRKERDVAKAEIERLNNLQPNAIRPMLEAKLTQANQRIKELEAELNNKTQ